MHEPICLPPIRFTLGARLYTASDLFLGVLALFVLDAIVAWIVWSAFSNAVYLIAAVFAIVAVALAWLGIAIKRRAKADGKRRHHARLILEAAGPHTTDDELSQLVWARMIQSNATRDDPKVLQTNFVEELETRLNRPIPRLWIVNEADALSPKPHTVIPTAEAGPPDQRLLTAVFAKQTTRGTNTIAPQRFACRPTRFGLQITSASREGDLSAALIASVLCAFVGAIMLTVAPWLGGFLLILALAIGIAGVANVYRDKPPREWAIAIAEGRAWIVRLQRRRVTQANPINEQALAITFPARHPAFLGEGSTHRTRIIIPAMPGIPSTVFEADGIDLPTLAASLGIDPDATNPADPHPTNDPPDSAPPDPTLIDPDQIDPQGW